MSPKLSLKNRVLRFAFTVSFCLVALADCSGGGGGNLEDTAANANQALQDVDTDWRDSDCLICDMGD